MSAHQALPRAEGEATLGLKLRGGQTVVDTLYQRGCSKIRLPRVDPGEPLQAVLLNTAGGMTDGDHVAQSVRWAPDTHAVVTTQAAERIYRSRSGDAFIHNNLDVATRARAVWLPQETILFDGARLQRSWRADLAADSALLAAETWTLGRTAMGESVRSGGLIDAWEIYREGQLLWADRFRYDSDLDGDLQKWIAQPAVLDGNITMMTMVVVCPDVDAVSSTVRDALELDCVTAGASKIGPLMLLRAVAANPVRLRGALIRVLDHLQSVPSAVPALDGFVLPRVFDC
ncbi:MAG: urease accessory protein UreD [Pseudomonadota bacterium]